jgi:hypothetical protein
LIFCKPQNFLGAENRVVRDHILEILIVQISAVSRLGWRQEPGSLQIVKTAANLLGSERPENLVHAVRQFRSKLPRVFRRVDKIERLFANGMDAKQRTDMSVDTLKGAPEKSVRRAHCGPNR